MRSRIGDQLVYFGKHGLNIAFELEQYIERVPDHFCTEFIGIEQEQRSFEASSTRILALRTVHLRLMIQAFLQILYELRLVGEVIFAEVHYHFCTRFHFGNA